MGGWDYATPGAYDLTLCVSGRRCLFGEVADATMHRNGLGEVVHRIWQHIHPEFPSIGLDEWIVMPNHIHGILVVTEPDGPSISTAMDWFKSATSTTYLERCQDRNAWHGHLWQRGFYDRILRSEKELTMRRQYIRDNPAAWHWDEYAPKVVRVDQRPVRLP